MSFFHPELSLTTLKNLEIVRQLVAEHPSYWADSPYCGETERLVTSWFGAKKMREAKVTEEIEENKKVSEDKWEFLYRETQSLYTKMQAAGVGEGDEAAQMAYFRTATSLLEKLVTLQERALNLKAIGEFHSSVLNVMESVLSPTQRTEVMEQLKKQLGK